METNTSDTKDTKPPLGDRLYDYLAQLRDVRAVGLLFFLVIVLLISWSGVKVIEMNYGLQKQIAELEQSVSLKELENDNLRLQNKYYESDEYLELSARKNLGLAAAGESVINVPKQVALNHTIDRNQTGIKSKTTPDVKKPFWQRNFQSWVDFLLHRQANNAA